jgi:hypothetical protein
MNDLQLTWLIPTLTQVLGAALALSILGFTYDSATHEHKPFISKLAESGRLIWLAMAAMIFALGISFTRAGWGIKGIAIALAVLLVALFLSIRKGGDTYRTLVTRQKITAQAIALALAKAWLAIFALLIVIWGAHLGWRVYHLYSLAKEVQSNPNQLQVENLVPMVKSAADDIGTLHANLSPLFPIFNALHRLPFIGIYLGQVDPLLTYANGLAQAGDEMVTGLEPLLADKDNGQSLLERASQVLTAGHDQFSDASGLIDQSAAARKNIHPDLLPSQLKLVFTMLDGRFNLLVAAAEFLQDAPAILGSSQPQNYLVLAQNRDELRSTGGFISGIGLVTLQNGKIESFTLGDSYAVDDFTKPYPTPPDALHRFMLADYWVTRDANWSPDFPTSARQAQTLYSLSTGVQTQGVIAFNQLAVRKVLEVIGPIQLSGVDTPISAENVEDYMRQAWAPQPEEGLSPDWWLHRKDFMQQLGNVIIEKVLSSSDQNQLMKLARLMADLLDEHQLLVYFNDPSAQSALDQAGWDGALHPGNSDYLYLVDSNVGFNKVDSVIQRSLSYQVDLRDLDNPTARVTLTYQHSGTGNSPCVQVASYGNGTYQDMQQRCYWDYWRLYTPQGTQLLSSTAQPVPADELLNKQGWPGQVESLPGEASSQVFAGLLVLPIAKTATIDTSYRLPGSILHLTEAGQLEYSLRVDLQSGLNGLPFQLEVLLPPGMQISSASIALRAVNADKWTWQGVMEKPIQLKFILSYLQ